MYCDVISDASEGNVQEELEYARSKTVERAAVGASAEGAPRRREGLSMWNRLFDREGTQSRGVLAGFENTNEQSEKKSKT